MIRRMGRNLVPQNSTMNNRKEFLKYAAHDRGLSSHTFEEYISKTHGPIS